MSITQTYYLAHKARAKLSHEAAMPDHNLRLLVGHANLLDGLMIELADAEREQESWFNNSVRNASQSERKTPPAEDRHIQWADTIPEEEEDDEEDSDDYEDSSDDDSEISDDDIEMADTVSLRRVPSNKAVPASPKMEVVEIDMDDFEEDEGYEDEDYAELTLTRSPSHSVASSPPELEHADLEESSEDESMPPSPPTTLLPTFNDEKQQKEAGQQTAKFFDHSIHYMPTVRNSEGLVTAISVY